MSIIPALSAADLATFHGALAGAELQTARLLAVGGETWTVTRTTVVNTTGGQPSNGIFGPVRGNSTVNTTATHGVTLYVFSEKPPVVVVAPGQSFLPTEQWIGIAPLPIDLADGDHLVSVADATLQFDVVSVVRHPSYARVELREST